jgi:AcrR family transcriptional regulator
MAVVWAERGYAESQLEEILEGANVSRERFDQLFSSKEECAAATANAYFAEVMRVVAETYSVDASEWDSVLKGIKGILELMEAHPSFAYVSYIGTRQMAPPMAHEIYVSGTAILTSGIDRLWAYSNVKARSASASRAAFGGVEALMRREIVAGRAEQLCELLPDVIYATTVSYLGQEEALHLARRAERLVAGTGAGVDG